MFDLSLLLPSLPFYLSFFAIKKVKFFKALTVYDEQKWGNSSVFPNTTIMIRTEWYLLNKYTVKAENLLQHHPHVYSTVYILLQYTITIVVLLWILFILLFGACHHHFVNLWLSAFEVCINKIKLSFAPSIEAFTSCRNGCCLNPTTKLWNCITFSWVFLISKAADGEDVGSSPGITN